MRLITSRSRAWTLRFCRDETGASALGFAFTALPFFTLVCGIIEMGAIMFTSALMEGALRDAARFGITGEEPAGATRLEQIETIITRRTVGMVDVEASQIEVIVYPSFATIGQGEDFVDGNGNGTYDAGETYTDANGNSQYDADLGEAGVGGAGDVVLYRIRYDYTLMLPVLAPLIGADGVMPLQASIAVRNEPFEGAGLTPAAGL